MFIISLLRVLRFRERLVSMRNGFKFLQQVESKRSQFEISYLSLHYIAVVCLTGSGTVISIHEERLQISEPGRKENESV